MEIKNLKVRKCKIEDYRFFYNLINKTLIIPFISKYYPKNPKKVRADFLKDYRVIKIILIGEKRIGFYQLNPSGNSVDIVKIFLSPAYQGKGLGRYFMKYFETLGYNRITLQVWDNNPAFKFYKKLGYNTIKKEKHKIHMEKKI